MERDRSACERRAYRLALLLTGSAGRAELVLESVLHAQPDVRAVDGAHLDRLTILRSRELEQGRVRGVRRGRAEALVSRDGRLDFWSDGIGNLPGQSREAWVLFRVLALPEREVARAMDCSTSAAKRHRDLADERLAGAADGLVESMRSRALTADVPHVIARRRELGRRRRRTETIVGIIALLAIAIIVARLVLGSV